MKNYKRISIMLILILLMQITLPELSNINIVPKSTAAELTETQTWDISEAEDNSVTATLTTDGTLTISGTGDMKDWSDTYSNPWCGYGENITKVVIEEGVTNIGAWAFENCTSLTETSIPKSVASIGELAFNGCTSLTEIKVDENNANYTSENGVLFNKDKTEIICYPAGKTETSYTIPDEVTTIGNYAFQACINLTEISIPGSVTSIGNSAFFHCISLTKITIPEGVISIGEGTFYDCRSLTEVTISEGVASIENYAFSECANLTSITIPDSVTSIGSCAFWHCASLTEISIPKGVTSIGDGTFCDCDSLTEINVDENNTNYASENGVLFNKDKTKLICYPAGKTETTCTIPAGVTSIGDEAFYECTNLTNIKIPAGVTNIGDHAFAFCEGLTEIAIPEGVKSIGDYAFVGCTNLTEIIIPDNVTNIGNYAFEGCTSLTIYTNSDYVAQYAKDNDIKYIVDKEGPTTSAQKTEVSKTSVTLTIKAEDSGVGLAEKAYSFDGGTTWQAENTKTYTENTSGITIKVRDKLGNMSTLSEEISITKAIRLESIAIKTAPTKTTYTEGDKFDKTGMVVVANYDNGTSTEITNYTIDKTGTLTTSDSKITISYTENGVTKTAEQAITVNAKQTTKTLKSITLEAAPTKTKYIQGKEQLDITGGKIKLIYSDNSEASIDITKDMITGFDNTKLGKQILTVTYEGKVVTYEVEIVAESNNKDGDNAADNSGDGAGDNKKDDGTNNENNGTSVDTSKGSKSDGTTKTTTGEDLTAKSLPYTGKTVGVISALLVILSILSYLGYKNII